MAKPGARIILAARFLFFCMEIGLAKSFGVLVPELEEQLQKSNAIVGLITSLSLAMMYLGSPIAKMLIHGCSRPHILTTLCGLAAGSALISTAFTRNLILIGILFMCVGLCCSVVNLQAFVLLHEYYQDEFPFASCISVLGIPIGAVVLPPITEKLLEQYGLSGTLLVVGALVLNMLPIGFVLKAPRSVKGDVGLQQEMTEDGLPMGTSIGNGRQYMQLPSDSTKPSPGACFEEKGHSTMVFDQSQTRKKDLAIQNESLFVGDNGNESCKAEVEHPQFSEDTVDTCTKGNTKSLLKNSVRSTKEIEQVEESIVSTCLSFLYFDVLIKEVLFSITFLPAVLLTFLVTGGWVLFIVLYAVEHGIDIARGTYLATSGAVGGVVSSITMSIGLRYRPGWSPQYLLFNQGLPTLVFFLQIIYSSYSYLVVMSFLIGFGLFGVNVTVEAVLSEVVDSRNFPDASSVFYLCVGLGYILSGYIAGFVRDQTGNIELLFVFLGLTSLLAVLLTLTMILLMKRRNLFKNGKHAEQKL